jgi:pyruvate,water dikinase
MEFIMLGYGAYFTFFQFCRRAFPEIPDQTVASMTSGVDVLMFRPDIELKRLARLAVELEIDAEFKKSRTPQETLNALEKRGASGRNWLQEFERARDPWFMTSSGDGYYHHHRSWNDNLALPFSALPRYIDLIKSGVNIVRDVEALHRERDRVIVEYRALLPTEEDRVAFDQILRLTQRVFPFVEDHKFYCEHWLTTVFFGKIREFGKMMVHYGLLEDVEDLFYLNHYESPQALGDVGIAWSSSSPARGTTHWPTVVAKRKAMLEKLRAWTPPPALGPIPDEINDPVMQMLWGITTESLQTWSHAEDSSDDKRLQGFAASPGVVEGIARVVKDVDEISLIQDGEILVCPITAPSWAPIFSKLKATVTDIGGTMSHAAIVAREYGLPAVVGTGFATKKIKTGSRLRVDGNTGVVTLLD